jgi:hypothetical protein
MATRIYFPGRGTLAEEMYLKGKEEGRALARAERAERLADVIMRALESRKLAITDSARAIITSCTDLDTLDRWFDRAFTVTDVDELFSEEEREKG